MKAIDHDKRKSNKTGPVALAAVATIAFAASAVGPEVSSANAAGLLGNHSQVMADRGCSPMVCGYNHNEVMATSAT